MSPHIFEAIIDNVTKNHSDDAQTAMKWLYTPELLFLSVVLSKSTSPCAAACKAHAEYLLRWKHVMNWTDDLSRGIGYLTQLKEFAEAPVPMQWSIADGLVAQARFIGQGCHDKLPLELLTVQTLERQTPAVLRNRLRDFFTRLENGTRRAMQDTPEAWRAWQDGVMARQRGLDIKNDSPAKFPILQTTHEATGTGRRQVVVRTVDLLNQHKGLMTDHAAEPGILGRGARPQTPSPAKRPPPWAIDV